MREISHFIHLWLYKNVTFRSSQLWKYKFNICKWIYTKHHANTAKPLVRCLFLFLFLLNYKSICIDLIYWKAICGTYFMVCSPWKNIEKQKNIAFFFWAAMSGLGKYCTGGSEQIGVYKVNLFMNALSPAQCQFTPCHHHTFTNLDCFNVNNIGVKSKQHNI